MPPGIRPAPPAGTARVAISGQIDSQPYTMVFWLQLTASAHTVNDLKAVVDGMVAAFHTDVMPYMSTTVTVTSAKASWIYAAGNEIQYEGIYSYAGGDSTGQVNNAATCAVIDWKIDAYYRGGHPRTYMPGVPATFILGAFELSDAYRAALTTGANTWRNAVNALTSGSITGVVLGTVSFQTGNAWRTPPVFRAYVATAVRQILGTQRRRLGGR